MAHRLDPSCEYLCARRRVSGCRQRRLSSASTAGVERGRTVPGDRRRDPLVRAVDRRLPPAGGPVTMGLVHGEGWAGGGRSLSAGRAADGRQVHSGGDRACVREGLDPERHLLVAEDPAAGDHAHPGEHVDAGGQREIRGRGVVQRRLPAGLLGAARVHAALGGQPVEVAHVADGRRHDGVLRRAAGEVAALEVHHARDEADEDRRAGDDRLDRAHRAERLGDADHERAGHGDRRRRAPHRHRHEADGDAGLARRPGRPPGCPRRSPAE